MDMLRNDQFALLASLDIRLQEKIALASKDYIRIEHCLDLPTVAETCRFKNLTALMIDLQLPSRFINDVISYWRRGKKRSRLIGFNGEDGSPDAHIATFRREPAAQIVDVNVSIQTLQEFVFAPLSTVAFVRD